MIIIFYFTVKYSPLIRDKLDTSVVGVGQIGVWRLTQLDYVSSDDVVHDDIKMEDNFQPELHDFYVTEISHGSYISYNHHG